MKRPGGGSLLTICSIVAIGSGSNDTHPLPQVIRCPKGWLPMGPWCVIVASMYPYTECPSQKRRYRQPYVVEPAFQKPTPGICISNQGTGPLLRCTKQFRLELRPPKPLEDPPGGKKKKLLTPERAKAKGFGDDFFAEHSPPPPPKIPPGTDWAPITRRSTRRKLQQGQVPARGFGLTDEGSSNFPSADYPQGLQEGFEPPTGGVSYNQTLGSRRIVPPELIPLNEPMIYPDVDDFDTPDDEWFRNPAEYRCVGTDRRIYTPHQWIERRETCPMGFNEVQRIYPNKTLYPDSEPEHICEAFPVLPPDPFCPAGYQPALISYNPSNFHNADAVHCFRQTRFKGRIWCPDTFTVTREPYPGVPFGGEVAPENVQMVYDPLVYDTYGLRALGPPRCIRNIAIPATQCDSIRCRDPVLDEVYKLIKHFAYFREQRDPRYMKFISVPSGKDLWWSPKGKAFPY